ncbi:MAG: phasin family protein [Alphaproteobacteria bacterium]|nr:phasin family protein [Alphaproteobacteria bacterium]MCB9975430.1 phasin family protein [Rhodospirillales bacterium]
MAQDFKFKAFFPNPELFKMGELPKVPYGFSCLLEMQRRNLQTLAETQQIAFRSFQTVMNRQAELFSQILSEQNCRTSEILKDSKPEEALARNAELFKESCKKTMEGMNEIGEIVRQSNSETSGVLNRRLKDSLNEIKSAIESDESDEGQRAA